MVAPLWNNYDTTVAGNVSWAIFENDNHTDLLASVDRLIQEEQGDVNFNGLWMLAASWEEVFDGVNVSLVCLVFTI